MTREEFESILEEAYIEGYNSALEDIQEDILDEEAFDLERDYDYYSESSKNVKKQMEKYADKTLAGKERGIDGYTMYRQSDIKTQNPKWLHNGDVHHVNTTIDEKDPKNQFYFVRRNKGINGKTSTPRGRIKVGDDDLLKERQDKKFKGNALKDHIKELKWLRE